VFVGEVRERKNKERERARERESERERKKERERDVPNESVTTTPSKPILFLRRPSMIGRLRVPGSPEGSSAGSTTWALMTSGALARMACVVLKWCFQRRRICRSSDSFSFKKVQKKAAEQFRGTRYLFEREQLHLLQPGEVVADDREAVVAVYGRVPMSGKVLDCGDDTCGLVPFHHLRRHHGSSRTASGGVVVVLWLCIVGRR
jgi:hypothetical protein